MKPVKILFLLLSGFCLTTGMQCNKNAEEPKPALPAETQSGKNTFGCLVNGEVWLPKGNFPYSGLSASIQYDILNLSVRQGNSSSFSISIRDLHAMGEFLLSDKVYASYFTKNEGDISAKEGKITITKFDKQNKIIAGRFWFDIETKSGVLLRITDGRFDVNYTN